MDQEYQHRLLAAQFDALQERVAHADLPIAPEMDGDIVFLRLTGLGGEREPYLAKIELHRYPVGPWRVGFIDPAADSTRATAPDRDPRFWPFSGVPGLQGGFHIAYPGPYRVFVCQPFTAEYFYYHPDDVWQPHVYDLPRVAQQLHEALKKAEHFSIWRPLFGLGGA